MTNLDIVMLSAYHDRNRSAVCPRSYSAAVLRRVLPLVVLTVLGAACASGVSSPRVLEPMSLEGEFPFSEDELLAALRIALPEKEARKEARRVTEAIRPGMDWAISEQTLLLLSIGSESGRRKVDELRRDQLSARRGTWASEHPGVPSDQLERAWEEFTAREAREWAEKREAMLREFGRQ